MNMISHVCTIILDTRYTSSSTIYKHTGISSIVSVKNVYKSHILGSIKCKPCFNMSKPKMIYAIREMHKIYKHKEISALQSMISNMSLHYNALHITLDKLYKRFVLKVQYLSTIFTNRSYRIEEQVDVNQPYGALSFELAGDTCDRFLRYEEQILMGQSCQGSRITYNSKQFGNLKAHNVLANTLVCNLGIMRLFVRSCREYSLLKILILVIITSLANKYSCINIYNSHRSSSYIYK